MKRILFVLVASSYFSFAIANEPIGGIDYSGVYETHGIVDLEGEDDVSYSGLTILQKKNDGYKFQQTSGVGLNTVGVAVVKDKLLIASWTANGQPAISIFEIRGKEMTGKWMMLAEVKWHVESLKFKMPFPEKK